MPQFQTPVTGRFRWVQLQAVKQGDTRVGGPMPRSTSLEGPPQHLGLVRRRGRRRSAERA